MRVSLILDMSNKCLENISNKNWHDNYQTNHIVGHIPPILKRLTNISQTNQIQVSEFINQSSLGYFWPMNTREVVFIAEIWNGLCQYNVPTWWSTTAVFYARRGPPLQNKTTYNMLRYQVQTVTVSSLLRRYPKL